jgi:hypothetical protein
MNVFEMMSRITVFILRQIFVSHPASCRDQGCTSSADWKNLRDSRVAAPSYAAAQIVLRRMLFCLLENADAR